MLGSTCYALVDAFTDMSGSDTKRREAYMSIASALLALILTVIILSLVGKWLWNNVLVDLFTVVKPVRSIWQILGLMIFLSLIR